MNQPERLVLFAMRSDGMAYTNAIQEAMQKQAMLRRQPLTVNLELLPVCNLDCKMCYVRTSAAQVERMGGLKSVNEWLAFAKQLREAGTMFLLLTGGEVFLYPGLKQLYTKLCEMGFSITINTNATLIDEEAIQWLREYPPRCVSVSLYGASEETYERLCGAKGMFERVKHAVILLAQNHIRYELKTVFTPLNINDLAHCCAIGRNLGVLHETGFYSFPPARRNDKAEQIRFSPCEVVEHSFERMRLYYPDEEFKAEIMKHRKKYEETKDTPGADIYGFTCSACNSACWITWQGRMTPCALLSEPYTLPFEQGFMKAWEELKQTCDRILMSPQCSHCDKRGVCLVCPAANYAETGRFDKASPFHCEMTRKQLDEMEKMVEGWSVDARQTEKTEGEAL